MRFSLFFFTGDGTIASPNKYSLLLSAARFADSHDFEALWTPERHMSRFGGLYPSPAVTAAALATITRRIAIRAGSIVLPLQNPIRVAEDWSMIDNLSGGRVGAAFASGWHVNDFVLAPERYHDRKELLFREIEIIRKLWRGESISFPNGEGTPVAASILPRPLQAELPAWITAQSDETFAQAGRGGFNLLTNFNYKSAGSLRNKIEVYRQARQSAGYDRGRVSVMTHAFVAETNDKAREIAGEALRSYFAVNIKLQERPAAGDSTSVLRPEEERFLARQAADRVIDTVGLIGDAATCLERAARCAELGVDELCCLLDFGVEEPAVLEGLCLLDRVATRFRESYRAERDARPA